MAGHVAARIAIESVGRGANSAENVVAALAVIGHIVARVAVSGVARGSEREGIVAAASKIEHAAGRVTVERELAPQIRTVA
ncbi:hypothetical protein [Bradyrhizobium liaoningense]